MNNTNSSQRNTFNLKMLLVLSLGHLVTDIYQGSLPAILPFLKESLSLSYAMTGAITMASSLTSSIIQPIFGYLSDRKGKAFLLPLGCFFAGIGLSLLSLPSSYGAVLLLVVISGLGVASFHPEGYKTAHFFVGDRMATGMSVFSVGGNLGFALGPIISVYIITHLGFNYLPIMISFSAIFIALLFCSWNTVAAAQPASVVKTAAAEGVRKGAYISLALVIAAVVMRSWTQFGLMIYIPFYVINHLEGDSIYAGQLVFFLLLGGVVGTIAGSPIADRWDHKKYLVLSMVLSSLAFPLIFIAKGAMLYAALFLIGMLLISTFTVTIVMAQQLLPNDLGIASGLMVGFAIGTGGLGVTILGVIADHFGLPTTLKCIWALPVAGIVLSLLIKYPLPPTQKERAYGPSD